MKLWLLLGLVFLIQEPVSSSGVLLAAYQSHYNVWLIHALFCVATVFDIALTYTIGFLIDKKYGHLRLISYIRRKFEIFSKAVGKYGKVVAIIVFVPIIFPVSGLFLPWLGISFLEALIFTFIGECIFWYGYEWLLVLGVKSFAQDSYVAICVILGVSLVFSVFLRILFKKLSNKNKKADQ